MQNIYTLTILNIFQGQRTWREDLRGRARDHTLGNPLLPPAQQSDPPTNLTTHEAIMLQYLPIRDDFEVSNISTPFRGGKLLSNTLRNTLSEPN